VNDLKRDLEGLRLGPTEGPAPRRRWIPLVIVLAILLTGAWAWRMSAAWLAPEVETVTVQQTAVAPTATAGDPVLTSSGYLVARRTAVVSAKIQGRLSVLRLEEGDTVREGDVIARLESADYEAQVARARAEVEQADAQIVSADATIQRTEADLAEFRRQFDRSSRLARELVLPRDEVDAAQSRVKVSEATLGESRAARTRAVAARGSAVANLAYAQAQLDNTVIRAPFSGTVVKKMAEVGESVAPIPPGVNISTASGAIVALADLNTLEMEADVSEANVAKLEPNQQAEVAVEAFPDRRYRAVLRQVIPTADRTRATVMVKVTLADRDENLKPEMSARVTFLAPAQAAAANKDATDRPAAPQRPSLTVPASAVVSRNSASVVFELVDDTARVRTVKTAPSRQQDVVTIAEGLSGGETLINRPPDTLKDGDKVRSKGR